MAEVTDIHAGRLTVKVAAFMTVLVWCRAHLGAKCLLGSLLGLGLNPAALLSRRISCTAMTRDVSLNLMHSTSTKG